MLVFATLILILVIATILFMNLGPQFGGNHSKEDIARYEASGHYAEGKFQNLMPTSLDYSLKGIVNMTKAFIKGNPNKSPLKDLPQEQLDSNDWNVASGDQLMWFGHSAFLLKMNGKNILLDPMLGKSPAPHPTLGTSRYSNSLPIEIDALPEIDLVLISHDHYDHLDYGSILKLKEKTKKFYVPLGVGAHLRAWGVAESKIREFNWWDETDLEGIDLAFTPARHFSGRKLGNNYSTLWGAWVLRSESTRLFFSGDSGYGEHFKEIGEKYGPFDLALIECGQYNVNWPEIHMMPEETAQAAKDVRASVMMPIHWGAFTLALHDWNEPPARSLAKAEELGVQMITPVIGDVLALEALPAAVEPWWR